MAGISSYLISHPKSKYDFSSIVNFFDKASNSIQISSLTVVSNNQHELKEISNKDFFASEIGIISLNFKWYFYLNEKNNRKSKLLFLLMYISLDVVKLFINLLQYLLSKNLRNEFKINKLRILNINRSHLNTWKLGLESSSDFVCVLEDDGLVTNELELRAVFNYISSYRSFGEMVFFDLSNSFSIEQLGASNLSSKVLDVADLMNQTVSLSERPITNTCCAIVYSRSLLVQIYDFVEKELKYFGKRTIPIDWLINKFLLSNRSNSNLKSFHVWPGVILQRSLHTSS